VSTKFGFRVVDVDSHVYEPQAVWDDYVEPGYQAVARSAFWHGLDGDGNAVTVLNGAVAPELNRSRLIRQAIWRPGSTPESIGSLDPEVFCELNPGAFDPVARLEDMDTMGVDQTVLYPTLFGEYLPLVENPDVAAVLSRAYNDWVWDFASHCPDRLIPVAVLPLQSSFFALAELDRVAGKGFGAVVIRPMAYPSSRWGASSSGARVQKAQAPIIGSGVSERRGEFVEGASFRPVWARIAQLSLVACLHPSTGITSPEQTSAGSWIERVSQRLGIGHSVAEPVAYLQDNAIFLTAACFHGLMEDFPDLRLAFLHAGASWVPLTLEKSETYLWLSPNTAAAPVSLEPEHVFMDHPAAVSFDSWETSVGDLTDLFATKAAWGSRYPHHDSAEPAEAVAMLDTCGVEASVIQALMGGNADALFGLADSKRR